MIRVHALAEPGALAFYGTLQPPYHVAHDLAEAAPIIANTVRSCGVDRPQKSDRGAAEHSRSRPLTGGDYVGRAERPIDSLEAASPDRCVLPRRLALGAFHVPVDQRAEPSLSRHWLARRIGRVAHGLSLLAHVHKLGAWVWARIQPRAAV